MGRDVVDPEKGTSIIDRLRSRTIVAGSPAAKQEARSRADLRIGALGSGSDYTPFIQHLGIASLNLGFGGEDSGGDYHTIYDSYDNYIRFKDGEFIYGVALAKTAGRSILRFANAEVLPFDFNNFSNTVQMYTTEVKKELEASRSKAEEHNKWITESRYDAVADPKKLYIKPVSAPVAPYMNFAPLENALAALEKSAAAYAKASANLSNLSGKHLSQLNEILYKTERSLIHSDGLPRRPWYKHQIYAPGFYTGYGVKTLPMIREAIEQRNWEEAEQGITRVSENLKKFSLQIDKATELLK